MNKLYIESIFFVQNLIQYVIFFYILSYKVKYFRLFLI